VVTQIRPFSGPDGVSPQCTSCELTVGRASGRRSSPTITRSGRRAAGAISRYEVIAPRSTRREERKRRFRRATTDPHHGNVCDTSDRAGDPYERQGPGASSGVEGNCTRSHADQASWAVEAALASPTTVEADRRRDCTSATSGSRGPQKTGGAPPRSRDEKGALVLGRRPAGFGARRNHLKVHCLTHSAEKAAAGQDERVDGREEAYSATSTATRPGYAIATTPLPDGRSW